MVGWRSEVLPVSRPTLREMIDVSDPDSFADGFPHAWFRELRREAPVCWHEGDVHGGPGYWIVSRYDDVQMVSKNPRVFLSGKGNQIQDPMPGELENTRSMINMDPPAHPRYRKLVSQGFTPKAVAQMGETIASKGPVAVRLAKRVIQQGQDAHLSTANALEQNAFGLVFASEDRTEGSESPT